MSAEAIAASASGLSGTFETLTTAFTSAASFVVPHLAMIYGFAVFPGMEAAVAGLLPGLEHTGQHGLAFDV